MIGVEGRGIDAGQVRVLGIVVAAGSPAEAIRANASSI